MGVVVLLSLQQLRVSPLHEPVQVGAGRGGHGDQVPIGPDLQTHQGDEGPQRLVGLGGASSRQTVRRETSTWLATSLNFRESENSPEFIKGKLTHHVDKVDNFEDPLSELRLISIHLLVLKDSGVM